MISHFPVLYPGELLYSGCGRFSDRMKYPTIGATMLELFGNRLAVPAVDLPHQIDRLVENLPPGHIYNADTLIDQHTLLPLYAPFLTIRNFDRMRASMRGASRRTTNLLAGISAGRVRPPLYLRNCPCCDAENIKRYGETYWHRLHQIPGVDICPYHDVFLQDSNVLRINTKNRHAFHTAQHAFRSENVQAVDPENRTHLLIATLAKTAAGIIDKLRLPEGPLAVRERYEDRLQASGYLTLGGSIRLGDLRRDLIKVFTAPLLALLQSDLPDEPGAGWLAPMFSPRERINAPLRHLLLMTFFGDTADSFFDKGVTRAQPSAGSSYPCLNVVCPAHSQPLIENLEYKRTKDRRRILTLFRCPTCGQASTRNNEGKKLKRVIEWGHLWEEKLKLLWSDLSLSVTHIKHALHSDHMTIKRHAAKAGLPFPRLRQGRPSVMKFTMPLKKSRARFTVEARRAEYIDLRNAQPMATGRQLRESHAGLVTWLYRHDREWMLKNAPRTVNWARPKTVVDWHARDEVVSGQVVTVALQIKNALGKPQRVSFATINREIRARLQLYINPKTMPLTRLALQGVVENPEQFCLRRIHYVAKSFVAENMIPSRSEFLRAAGINPERKVSGLIMDATEGALAQISCAVENSPPPRFSVQSA